MSENADIKKYFSDTSSKPELFNQMGFKQLSRIETDAESERTTGEPSVCKLFQTPNNNGTNSEAGRFFDMISPNPTDVYSGLPGFDNSKDPNDSNLSHVFMESAPIPKPSRVCETDRSRDAWIPSDVTRRTLISMVTSPPGNFTPDRETLTMPGVVLEEDMKDTVLEAVNHYLGPAEAAHRKVLTASDVTQDDRGLRDLIEAGCYRAAVNLTKPLLSIYGQGAGRAGHPSKHTAHSVQLWFTRLALLVKLRNFMLADVESEPFGDLDKPDLFFQFYPELYGGRMGSMVPFGFRLLVGQIPMYIEKHQICLTRLHMILATVRKMLGNLEKCLLEDGAPCELSPESREEAVGVWKSRETQVQHAIVNCALSFKDYTLAVEVMEVLLAKELAEEQKARLQSALGRILLQLGDVISAEKQFKALRQMCDPSNNVRCLVDTGLRMVADIQFKEALAIFERAAKLDPSNVMILSNMAVCLLYMGRLKDAVTLLESGLEAYPTLALHESYLINLCNLYELRSTQSLGAKLKLLSLISRYRGDNVNIACLKLN